MKMSNGAPLSITMVDKQLNQPAIHRYTALVQELMGVRLNKGNYVMDGTMGNGFDTCFLWQSVCPEGHVFAFDIQQQAIDNTRQRLIKAGCRWPNHEISLIHDCHSRISEYLSHPVKAAMFNLGYLPGGSKDKITTWINLRSALHALTTEGLLEAGGVISIISYGGHEGGMEEQRNLLEYVHQLKEPQWHVTEIRKTNACMSTAPLLIIIQQN